MGPEYDLLGEQMEELTGKTAFKCEACKDATFRGLQAALLKDAVVGASSVTIPTNIFVDADKGRMGACLVQGDEVIWWLRQRLKSAQLYWSITRKETRVLMEAVQPWGDVLVRSDYRLYGSRG